MTNYERIINMNVVELAEFLNNFHSSCNCCVYGDLDCLHDKELSCIDGICKYLKKESEKLKIENQSLRSLADERICTMKKIDNRTNKRW